MRFGVVALLFSLIVGSGAPAFAAMAYPVPLATPIIPAGVATLTVTSTSLKNGETMPDKNITCAQGTTQGGNVSPQLSWTPGPPGTQSYVVMEFDTDAPTGVGFHQWVVMNIPANVTSIPEDFSKNVESIPGAVQGYNDGGYTGYRGGCPPVGDAPHHYFYTVTAMDTVFKGVGAGTTGTAVDFMMSKAGHVLARGQIVVTYKR